MSALRRAIVAMAAVVAGSCSNLVKIQDQQKPDNISICTATGAEEVCNGVDDDCNGVIDDVKGACGEDACAPGRRVCVDGVEACAGGVARQPELCDGVDNDCNERIDEDFPTLGQPCTVGRGVCAATGTVVCAADGRGTTCSATPGEPGDERINPCNSKDDDCDGYVDYYLDGTRPVSVCATTTPPPPMCVPTGLEICDGIDNDCNGKIDDLAGSCGSDVGTCRPGRRVCVDGVESCAGGVVDRPEICDGLDNNCNEKIDEDFPTLGQTCTVGRGACAATGTVICASDGHGTTCNATAGTPGDERTDPCNKKDDDCDGYVDFYLDGGRAISVCPTTTPPPPCVPTGPETCDGIDNDCNDKIDDLAGTCGSNVGACRLGRRVCADGVEACAGGVTSQPELCDGVDNDCDNAVDEDFPTLGRTCTVGRGVCAATGIVVCAADGRGTTCNATAGQPGDERTTPCNNKDDDCDGYVDFYLDGDRPVSVCPTTTPPPPPCVPTGPEVCDGSDNDCNGKIDDLAGACGPNVGACRSGRRVCVDGVESCAGGVLARPEVCDGVDNDCDNAVDEDFPTLGQTCTVGRGVCAATGTVVCAADGRGTACSASAGTPGDERTDPCNQKDDDCDGYVDFYLDGGRAISVCPPTTTPPPPCIPTGPEICDGVDNDCNNKIDDLAGSCGSNVGACRPGRRACVDGVEACAGAVTPQPEICDGVDNDCDNATDEDFPTLGQTCTVGRGICAATGTVVCAAGGRGTTCSATAGTARDERADPCNMLDDDCDGYIDYYLDGGRPISVCPVTLPPPPPCVPTGAEICDGVDNDCNTKVDDLAGNCGSTVGACRAGRRACVDGVETCAGAVTPQPELCDGVDNDCDSATDEDFPTLGQPCTVGRGVCAATGTVVCAADGRGTTCSATAGTPGDERTNPCNMLDDDCDGLPDYYIEDGRPVSVCVCEAPRISPPGSDKDYGSRSICMGDFDRNLLCTVDGNGQLLMHFCVDERKTQELWAQCIFASVSSLDRFDVDHHGAGLLEVVFENDAPIVGGLNMYVGKYPKRKYYNLSFGTLPAGVHRKIFRPTDAACAFYGDGPNPPNCVDPANTAPEGCIPANCRSGCANGDWTQSGQYPECVFSYAGVPLWLTLESVPDNTPSQTATVTIRSIVHHGATCICSATSSCKDQTRTFCDLSLPVDGRGICRTP